MSKSIKKKGFDRKAPITSRRPKMVMNQLEFILGDQQQNTRTSTKRPKTSSLVRHPQKKSQQKAYHTIQSSIGEIAIPEPVKIRSIPIHPISREPSVVEESETSYSDDGDKFTYEYQYPKNNSDVYLTLSFLKTAASQLKISSLLETTPLFFRTLYTDGSLDPELISSISVNLLPIDLRRFVSNYSQEVNFFNAISKCIDAYDIEKILCNLLPIERATLWARTENSEYIISKTMNEVLPINRSIVGYSLLKNIDIITGDPGNSPGFVIDVDMPLLRNCKSMILLPLLTSGQPVAVLQVIGFQNLISKAQIEFPPYHIELLKIVRNIIQNRFYNIEPSRKVPSQITSVFTGIEMTDVQTISKRFCKIFQDLIPCDAAEIFEFNERNKIITRLTDSATFDESSGGISYAAALSTEAISAPHAKKHAAFNVSIDGLLTNRSILSKSYFDNRNHYVITLRAKWKSPAFIPRDVELADEIAPVMCETMKLSKQINNRNEQFDAFKRRCQVIEVVNKTLNLFVNTTNDHWNDFQEFAHQIFDCEKCFICVFDGENMKFNPSDVLFPFDQCIAGESYNYREERNLNVDPIRSNNKNINVNNFDLSLYTQLGVKINTSFAFPYRSFKKVVGSIELINPDPNLLDEFAQKMTSIVCSLMFPDIISSSNDDF